MDQPKISVIVPCYNQAQYLDECLQSVLDQTYPNWECIIVNDGSPDNTEEVALEWTKKDSRFQYISKQNGGLSSARNAGIAEANGDWILPLDCDDKIGTRYLEYAQKEFDKGYSIIYCEAEYFGEQTGRITLKNYQYEFLLLKNMIFCSAFFRKKDWKKIDGYDVNMHHGLEDWEFWIAMLNKDKKVLKIPEVCFYYRIKDKSMLISLLGPKEKLMKDYVVKKHITTYNKIYGNCIDILEKNESLQQQVNFYNNSKIYIATKYIQNIYYRLREKLFLSKS